jgi:hypothetical protein
MPDPTPKEIAAAEAEQVTAAAVENAKKVTDKAEMVAAALLAANKSSDDRVTKALSDALRDVFGEHASSGRFVDVSRIPLICKSIIDTNAKLVEISEKLDKKYVTNEVFMPVKSLVYGFVGLVLVAVVGALLFLVIASPGRTTVQPNQTTQTQVVK